MDEKSLRAAIRTTRFGCNLIYRERTGSTNSVARDAALRGAPEGTVVVASFQTGGRGRLGRRWLAPADTCLLCSVLFRPTLPPAHVQHLTMVCALASADAIQTTAGLAVGLKWPNDLVVQVADGRPSAPGWRKLAGLLTETGLSGERLEYAIVGIGINVNVGSETLPSLAPDATSLLAEIGHLVDIPSLLGSLLQGIEHRYRLVQEGNSPYPEWAANLATLGQSVVASTAAGSVAGVAERVDETGALLLRTRDGALRRLTAGDVSLQSRSATS